MYAFHHSFHLIQLRCCFFVTSLIQLSLNSRFVTTFCLVVAVAGSTFTSAPRCCVPANHQSNIAAFVCRHFQLVFYQI